VTLPDFSKVFAVLALALGKDADVVTIKAYHRVLGDLEPEFVGLAAERLARQVNADGEAWFPKAPEWRVAALKIEHERTEELRVRLRKLPEPLCVDCLDTGRRIVREPNRYGVCECQALRRLEILGRRPLPMLPSGPEAT
jgi:hypothetical protein